MSIRSEVLEMKREVAQVKEQSLAMELLSDYKKANKRLFIIWVVTFVAFIGLLGYTIYLLNDIGTESDSIDIKDVEKIDNSNVKIGDDVWEK